MPVKPSIKPDAFSAFLIETLAPSNEAVTVANKDGYILGANPAVEQVYRVPVGDLIGKHPLYFCPDTPEWKELSRKIWEAIKTEGGWDGVVVNKEPRTGREFAILLRVRRVSHGNRRYVISWARPFPSGSPFGLSVEQAKCFTLLGQGMTIKEIGARLESKRTSVSTHLQRVWAKLGISRSYSTSEISALAIRCHEAGWDSTMKLNAGLVKAARSMGGGATVEA